MSSVVVLAKSTRGPFHHPNLRSQHQHLPTTDSALLILVMLYRPGHGAVPPATHMARHTYQDHSGSPIRSPSLGSHPAGLWFWCLAKVNGQNEPSITRYKAKCKMKIGRRHDVPVRPPARRKIDQSTSWGRTTPSLVHGRGTTTGP